MDIEKTNITGVQLIHLESHSDDRGVFVELFEREKFASLGIDQDFQQDAYSRSNKKGTVRGLHYQADPHAQSKLVRCSQGAVFEVVVDLRKSSTSYHQIFSTELSADKLTWLYLPVGLAHGFCTLIDHTQINYKIAGDYVPDLTSGINWQDRTLAIDWPISPGSAILSDKDNNLPELDNLDVRFS
jgi:dTDP-4-dehydrorhamnose 3,5-epimerase